MEVGECPMGNRFAGGDASGMTNPRLLRGRHSQAGAYYAITSVTRHRRPLFRDRRIAQCVVDAVGQESVAVNTMAWVVMPDHVHWLFALKDGELGSVVQGMKVRTARAIRLVTGWRGSMWQSGYYDHRLRSDEDLLSQARYIIANPLRAGLVERLSEYPLWWCRWGLTESDL